MIKRKKKEKEIKKQSLPTTKGAQRKEGGKVMALIGRKAFIVIFLFLISFGVFAPSLKNDFVWDDIGVIQNNYNAFKSFNITSILIPKDKITKKIGYYRPVVFTSMFVDKSIWGLSPVGFHLSNLVFHSISTVLFYFLVLLLLDKFRVRGKEGIAFLSSLLFALHPMHVESVSWIAGRTDVLCGLFFFLAFIIYILSYRKLVFLPLSALCFYLSLLSKEVAFAFPILALSFDLMSGRYEGRVNVLKYAVCVALVSIYIYLRGRAFIVIPEVSGERVQGAVSEGSQAWGVFKVLLNSYLFYIKELVFPFKFNAFIPTVPGGLYNLFSSVFVISFLCVVGFVSVRKRENITAFSIFWVLLTLAPSSIISISWVAVTPLAERYLYVPSAGFCILLGYLILEAGKRMNAQKVSWAIGLLLCIFYLFFTIDRQSVWRDDLTLWADTSKHSPYHPVPHLNYGVALRSVGRKDEAIRELLIAFNSETSNTKRDKARIATNLGVAYGDKGDFRSAEEWLLKSLSYDRRYGITYYQLGLIYFVKGEQGDFSAYKKAEKYMKKTLKRSPRFGRAYFVLATIYLRLGENNKAKKNARKALLNGLDVSLAKEAEYILKISD